MEKEFQFCSWSLIVTGTIGFAANAKMLINAARRKKFPRRISSFFVVIGGTNAVLCLAYIGGSITLYANIEASLIFRSIEKSAFCTLLLVQECINLALAYNRYLAVAYPFKFYANSTQNLGKKFAFAALVISIISFSIGVPSVLFEKSEILIYTGAVCRGTGCIPLSIAYYRIYKIVTDARKRVQDLELHVNGQADTSQQVRRQVRPRTYIKICLGVTLSYMLSNISAIVLAILSPRFVLDCHSTSGILTVVRQNLLILNIIFDAFWYFYVKR